MRILWLCNMPPSAVEQAITGRRGSGLWMDRTLEDLRRSRHTVRILCRKDREAQGTLDESCSYHAFLGKAPQEPVPELEEMFRQELETFRPQVIHIWGTEYAHCLAMLRAAAGENRLAHTVVSLQGIISACAPCYAGGLPDSVVRGYTLRDLLRRDNIRQQQKKFAARGENECRALAMANHIMGRTDWDRAMTERLAPQARYYTCNETLREPFYAGQWQYAACQKHRIFAASCLYPLKGFHHLLEAAAALLPRYPNLIAAVPGTDPLAGNFRQKLRQDGYARYLGRLIRRYHLQDHVEFLGHLSPEQMKEQYLKANVFVLPSSLENSPNSLGEAMLLGVPAAAAAVGGVPTMLIDREEGLLYREPGALAGSIDEIFSMGQQAEALGSRGREHALLTHDPDRNLKALLEIYAAVKEDT